MGLFSGFKRFYHTALGRPFKLAVRINKGQGTTVVFLHGIAADYRVWEPTAEKLSSLVHVIVIDLLGCGESPDPNYMNYSVHDHASSVIYTLNSLRIKEPIILVGHSLGGLISMEVARKDPELISRLILASPPVFTKDITGIASQLKASIYNQTYLTIINQPKLTTDAAALVARIQPKDSLFILNKDTWTAFRQSLLNSVLSTHNYNTLVTLSTPTDIIYGRFDMLILKKPLTTAVSKNHNLTFHTLNEPHEVTSNYSDYVVKLIKLILTDLHKHNKHNPQK